MEFMETFAQLTELGPNFAHGFVGRIPGIDVEGEKAEVLEKLQPYHDDAVVDLGFTKEDLWMGEQVHGTGIAVVPVAGQTCPIPGVDGVCTAQKGVLLGIHVADCCAVYLVDPVTNVVGLLHAGWRGSALGIMGRGVLTMVQKLGADVANIRVLLGPCIRVPNYDTDFPAELRRDAMALGILPAHFHDCNICTFEEEARYYSYHREKGKTGRMLALLGMRE